MFDPTPGAAAESIDNLQLPASSERVPRTPDCQVTLDRRADGSVAVSIETARLKLEPVSMNDLAEYHSLLFGDHSVMEKFGTGEVRPLEKVQDRIEAWTKRWQSGDPFSALTIRERDGSFIGMVVMGHGEQPGRSEIAYMIRHDAWGQRFGTEAVTAAIKQLAPLLRAEAFKTDGEAFNLIEATARVDNPASVRILERIGMTAVRESEKFGATRKHFELTV